MKYKYLVLLSITTFLTYSQSIPIKNKKSNFFVNNATITGHVYKDVNGNGSQNIGEPSLANVDVLLNQSDGSFQVVTTDVNGDWTALVSSGPTTVSLDQNDLPPIAGRIETEGTDPNIVNAVAFQSTYAGTDGFFYVGKLTGHLYFDNNGNGIQNNPTEPNMPNVNVIITDAFGNVYNTTTDAFGNWNVTAGIGPATVMIVTTNSNFPIGALQTEGSNPTAATVIQSVTTFTENDGFFQRGTATGHLYFDLNGNGIQDLGENNMSNITVSILDVLNVTHTVTTDVNGNWTIILPVGTANATINTFSAGFPQGSLQTQGTNPTIFTVVNNSTTATGNNGFYNKGTLKGHLYLDSNNNGIQNATEPNLANISVIITESNGTTQNVITNLLGNWEAIVNSGATNSLIDITDPDFPIGAIQTQGINPITTNVITNQIVFTINCGFFLPLDTDGDGILDYIEIANSTSVSDPCSPTHLPGYTGYVSTNTIWQAADCDGDGIANGIEKTNNTDPYNPCSPMPLSNNSNFDATNPTWASFDCDGDGLSNGQEATLTTNPFLADTDGDGIGDGIEIANSSNPKDPCSPSHNAGYTGYSASNPLWQASDCDGDGILNGIERNNSTDPYNPCSPIPTSTSTGYNPSNPTWSIADCDGDGLTNGQEATMTTNPFLVDTDGDGINDNIEVTNNSNPKDPCSPTHIAGYTGYVATNLLWQTADCDGDGIANGIEKTNNTDPYNPCSPIPNSNNLSFDASNPIWIVADCDGDGLTNGQETNLTTNPFLADTDGDGINDGLEIANSTNPKDPCSPINSPGYIGFSGTNIVWQASDCDGDGVLNGTEFTNHTDPFSPCSPAQLPGYSGYNAANPFWINADCDNDGVNNGTEHNNGTDPYDDSDNGIKIFNAISPNHDGKNETFFIVGIEFFRNNNLSIVNRWGVEVYNINDYKNDFNGISKGRLTINENEKLPSGTYFYKFTFTNSNGDVKDTNGYLYIN